MYTVSTYAPRRTHIRPPPPSSVPLTSHERTEQTSKCARPNYSLLPYETNPKPHPQSAPSLSQLASPLSLFAHYECERYVYRSRANRNRWDFMESQTDKAHETIKGMWCRLTATHHSQNTHLALLPKVVCARWLKSRAWCRSPRIRLRSDRFINIHNPFKWLDDNPWHAFN